MSVEDKLDKILALLDSAPMDDQHPFRSEAQKEKYESNLMFVYRRYQAAIFYSKTIMAMIEMENEAIKKYSEDDEAILDQGSTVELIQKEILMDNRYSYQFIAFISAIKSGVDFLSKIMIRHMQGLTGDSVKTLLRLVDKKQCRLLDVIRQNKDWLEFVSEYRNRLIHNYNQVYYIGSEYVKSGSCTTLIIYPVLVPKDLPRFELDTRRSRLEDNIEQKITRIERVSEVIIGDNIERKSDIIVLPSDAYIPIEEFCKEQCHKYESLFEESLDALAEIELRKITVNAIKS